MWLAIYRLSIIIYKEGETETVGVAFATVVAPLHRRRAAHFLYRRLTRSHALKILLCPLDILILRTTKELKKEILNPLIRHKYSAFEILTIVKRYVFSPIAY